MRRLGWALGGLLAGAAVAVAMGALLPMVTPISQAEGAYAMGVAFFWVPVGAVLGLVLGLIAGRR